MIDLRLNLKAVMDDESLAEVLRIDFKMMPKFNLMLAKDEEALEAELLEARSNEANKEEIEEIKKRGQRLLYFRMSGHGIYHEVRWENDLLSRIEYRDRVICLIFEQMVAQTAKLDGCLEILTEMHPEVLFMKICTKDAKRVVGNLNIKRFPTIIICNGGGVIDMIVGAEEAGMSEQEPLDMLEWRLSRSKILSCKGKISRPRTHRVINSRPRFRRLKNFKDYMTLVAIQEEKESDDDGSDKEAVGKDISSANSSSKKKEKEFDARQVSVVRSSLSGMQENVTKEAVAKRTSIISKPSMKFPFPRFSLNRLKREFRFRRHSKSTCTQTEFVEKEPVPGTSKSIPR